MTAITPDTPPDTPPAAPDSEPALQRAARLLNGRLFFVVGCQKSGTTWVQKLLDGHPHMVCRGEAYLVPVLLPKLGRALQEYHHQHKAGSDGQFADADLVALFAVACGLLMSHWTEGDPAIQAVGEKTPEHAQCLPLLKQVFPQARVIHVVRDPRDVVVSGWFHNQRKQSALFQKIGKDMASYADYLMQHHWLPYIQKARAFGREHPQAYLELRYEHLHADPVAAIVAMLEHVGVDASAEMVDRCRQAGAFETLAGGRAAGQEDRQSFFRKGVVGDWREHLDEAAADVIARHGGDLMADLGYAT